MPEPYQPEYLFVWDKEAKKVVASYYVDKPGRRVPDDVSGGAIPHQLDEHLEALDALKKRYPPDRYELGGGSADSLEACVEWYFGGARIDYDHFFERDDDD